MHLVIIGGSDAGISAALRARELDPSAEVSVVVADSFANFSICGIPYYVSGDVAHWQDLAHRTLDDLEATGMKVALNSLATQIDPLERRLQITDALGKECQLSFDALVIGTGATSIVPPIDGFNGEGALGPTDGVHLLHSMGDTFELMLSLERLAPKSAAIVGAGYIGLEMAEGLHAHGIAITQFERLSEVLPTVDNELGKRVRDELCSHGIEVFTNSTVRRISHAPSGSPGRLLIESINSTDQLQNVFVDIALVVAGVRPDVALAKEAGISIGPNGAIEVDRAMRTNLEHIFAAGDCVETHHRLLGTTYLPLGTTAHKQGRIAGENALGGSSEFAGSLGTQVVKLFDMAVARTGLRDHEAARAGYDPVTFEIEADDHKAYYPGGHRITMRFTGDRSSRRLLGVQLFGHRDAAVAKRIDIAATAIYHEMSVDEISDLDLSYTPPLGSPWDAIQIGAQAWTTMLLRENAQEHYPGTRV
ncbi:MAG TPA: FAD-dependent oxidoreductase [Acidimicrobiales bacterium]|nr:FAD-dependent oxidoreductase [Acidimicrobiales bacterium]